MVFYTCSCCGESLKKNKVEKHISFCYGCQYVTCMDCNKDFWGDEYLSHTTCVSEEERYSASGYQSKPNKGELKQQEWIKKIEMTIHDSKHLSHRAILLLKRLQDYGNIPRKKIKFLNFLKNSLQVRDDTLTEEVWNAFSSSTKPVDIVSELESKDSLISHAETENTKNISTENVKPLANVDEYDETKSNKENKKKKRRAEEEIKPEDSKKRKCTGKPSQGHTANGKFPWIKAIRSCLVAKGGEMSMKRLKKKVLKEWELFQDAQQDRKRTLDDSEVTLLFIKKLKKDSKIRISKNKVQLCS